MASLTSAVSTSDGHYIPVVLRVKRKRTGDPVEALVVDSKVRKVDKEDVSDTNEVSSVFHLCGSFSEGTQDDKSLLNIVKSFKEHKTNVKTSSFSKLSISESKEHSRTQKKESSTHGRYKLISSHRCLKEETQEEPQLHLYEILDEGDIMELETKDTTSSQSLPTGGEDTATITCNSTVLVREKIHHPLTEDYIYDIYMSRQCSMEVVSSFDWNTLSRYCYEPELVHDIIDSDEDYYEDEDDSNDESNWRNEYPDEESSSNTSGSRDSTEDLTYRHREPYYDEFEFFSSSSRFYNQDEFNDEYNNSNDEEDIDY